jgi:hypothetical protein
MDIVDSLYSDFDDTPTEIIDYKLLEFILKPYNNVFVYYQNCFGEKKGDNYDFSQSAEINLKKIIREELKHIFCELLNQQCGKLINKLIEIEESGSDKARELRHLIDRCSIFKKNYYKKIKINRLLKISKEILFTQNIK